MRTDSGNYRNLQRTICHFPKYEFCIKLLGTDLVNQQVMFIYMWEKQSELLDELIQSLQHRGINSVFSTQCYLHQSLNRWQVKLYLNVLIIYKIGPVWVVIVLSPTTEVCSLIDSSRKLVFRHLPKTEDFTNQFAIYIGDLLSKYVCKLTWCWRRTIYNDTTGFIFYTCLSTITDNKLYSIIPPIV